MLGAACPKDQETAKTMTVVGNIVHAIASLTGPRVAVRLLSGLPSLRP
ncbi:hypothetical protein [Desulfosporosinus sp. Sb-LF]|nr:hypothetical protein [Desulfosporosinus sp. Sb-LF]